MPFLCVLKASNELESDVSSASHLTAVDHEKLVKSLCPYRGELQHAPLENGVLYLSELAECISDKSEFTCTIPKNSVKNPQTSWLELRGAGRELVFRTDPLGSFPVWYLEEPGRLIITSEVKSLQALIDRVDVQLDSTALAQPGKRPADFSPYKRIKRLPPGQKLTVDSSLGLHMEGELPLNFKPDEKFNCMDTAREQLASALEHSSESIARVNQPCATFLSGGIDSSTATALMSRLSPQVTTYTLGTEFGNEYADAEELATHLDLPNHRIFADSQSALAHFERAIFCNEVVDGLTAETLAQLSLLCQAASQNVAHVVTGYGADLLFGSMLRHQLYMQVTGVDDLQSLIERTCWSGEFSPFFAWSLGIQVHHLFWDPAVMNCAFRIPDEANFDGEREKVPLRTLAVERGLMKEQHAFRKKYAMTDGTQFNRVLSEAHGLSDKHAYAEKDELCAAYLAKINL